MIEVDMVHRGSERLSFGCQPHLQLVLVVMYLPYTVIWVVNILLVKGVSQRTNQWVKGNSCWLLKYVCSGLDSYEN